MAQQLAQNPEMLMQILGSLAAGEDAEDGEGGGVPPGAQVISVTEEERAAIQRVSTTYDSNIILI
jgi:UV excision repair protein RAD23